MLRSSMFTRRLLCIVLLFSKPPASPSTQGLSCFRVHRDGEGRVEFTDFLEWWRGEEGTRSGLLGALVRVARMAVVGIFAPDGTAGRDARSVLTTKARGEARAQVSPESCVVVQTSLVDKIAQGFEVLSSEKQNPTRARRAIMNRFRRWLPLEPTRCFHLAVGGKIERCFRGCNHFRRARTSRVFGLALSFASCSQTFIIFVVGAGSRAQSQVTARIKPTMDVRTLHPCGVRGSSCRLGERLTAGGAF